LGSRTWRMGMRHLFMCIKAVWRLFSQGHCLRNFLSRVNIAERGKL
jgi:hypothetical protein